MPGDRWSRLLRRTKIAIGAASIALTAFAGHANETPAPRGGITEIRIISTQPAFGGTSFGSVGSYEILTGKGTPDRLRC
jgi:hypothetical protein